MIQHNSMTMTACCLAGVEHEAALILEHRRLHEGGILTNLAGGIGSMSGPAPLSLGRHAATLAGEPEDNPERATLNRFLLGIGPVASVPIKPVRQISRILPTTPHPTSRSPTLRCAYALIASASATVTRLVVGAIIAQAVTHQGVEAIIENGVARDILKGTLMAKLSCARGQSGFRGSGCRRGEGASPSRPPFGLAASLSPRCTRRV